MVVSSAFTVCQYPLASVIHTQDVYAPEYKFAPELTEALAAAFTNDTPAALSHTPHSHQLHPDTPPLKQPLSKRRLPSACSMMHIAVVFAPTPWGGGEEGTAPAVAAMHEWAQPLLTMMHRGEDDGCDNGNDGGNGGGDDGGNGGEMRGEQPSVIQAAGDHKVCRMTYGLTDILLCMYVIEKLCLCCRMSCIYTRITIQYPPPHPPTHPHTHQVVVHVPVRHAHSVVTWIAHHPAVHWYVCMIMYLLVCIWWCIWWCTLFFHVQLQYTLCTLSLHTLFTHAVHTPHSHRVEQHPDLIFHNQVAVGIAQSQLPPDPPRFMSTSQNSGQTTVNGQTIVNGQSVNATVFPLWAAGLTGAGMVVGIGDSGVGMFVCFVTGGGGG